MKCTKCGNDYPRTEEYFHKAHGNKDGLNKQCKKCRCDYMKKWNKENKLHIKNQHLKQHYNITLETYNILLQEQCKKCAICSKLPNAIDKRTNTPRQLTVDHDHKTGKIRGLLCFRCNAGLGHFNDDIEILKNAIGYLK